MAPKKNSQYQLLLPDHKVSYEMLPLDVLGILPEVQRQQVKTRVDKIDDDFVPSAAPALTVAPYAFDVMEADGVTPRHCLYAIIDGGHRWEVLFRQQFEEFRCEVHDGLNLQQQAVLFILRNREIKVPNALEQFNVGLVARLPLYVDTMAVLSSASHGPLRISGSPSLHAIAAVGALTNSIETYGTSAVEAAIEALDIAYRRSDAVQWDGALLQGTAKFFSVNTGIDVEILAERMARSPLTPSASRFKQEVIARSTTTAGGDPTSGGSGSRYMTAYRILVEVFNKRVRTGQRAA